MPVEGPKVQEVHETRHTATHQGRSGLVKRTTKRESRCRTTRHRQHSSDKRTTTSTPRTQGPNPVPPGQTRRAAEEGNGSEPNSIRKARWIKPTYRRSSTQQFAHASFAIIPPTVANQLIRDGTYVCGAKTYPKKLKTEPKQCTRCRK